MAPSLRDTLSRAALVAAAALATAGCRGSDPPPDVLWIVWDTVRADRLGVYGADAPTTPNLDRFAAGARVFEDGLAVAPTTVPNHASMFTGLLPAEHGASNAEPHLDPGHDTIAERLARAGYRTWLWSANPHIGRGARFAQGFEQVAHPWDRVHRRRAIALAREKLADGDGSGLAGRLAAQRIQAWALKDSGPLAGEALLAWLDTLPQGEPWFAFLNWMEAHQPVLPARRFRERVMDAEGVARSYRLERGWEAIWDHSFGLAEIPASDLAVIAGLYDAAIAELDHRLGKLLAALEVRGALDNAVVILTSDHGEHLGEHHLLDHQYSLHQPVLRVPLLIRDPSGRLAPGRDPRPVMNFDLFPTVLALAGIAPEGVDSHALSLLAPRDERARLAEYRAPFARALEGAVARHPGFDPAPWQERLRALVRGDAKWIAREAGGRALYDLADDPGETRDRRAREPALAERLERELEALANSLAPAPRGATRALPPGDRRRLEALGYGRGRDAD